MSQPPQKAENVRPNAFWAALPCVIICAAIVVAAYLLAHRNPPQPRRQWIPVVVATNGDVTVLGETRQMNFWTPSVRTKEYLTNSGPRSPDAWQILESENPVVDFGKMLHTNNEVLGFRRVEDWGHGRSIYKPGWWWTINVQNEFTPAEMGRIYQSFWKCSGPVFIEVVDSRGTAP
jgi:hypothetical protein